MDVISDPELCQPSQIVIQYCNFFPSPASVTRWFALGCIDRSTRNWSTTSRLRYSFLLMTFPVAFCNFSLPIQHQVFSCL
ncbi:hypothetical protein DFH94DRAFT_212133 [Russula ochroleuca]|uniref:Uncharacterized protein n=1 Tax=Russula ochroleuca TaxID=152965 RepID=A0A9P5JU65_9AGAM|nr:hypothetical protein DFH94DRAFT_499808 [Russula ochroleuca]KAF8470478.1 hypothetical protein DFH94DRAFT_212133 [Russula ochroleuca]